MLGNYTNALQISRPPQFVRASIWFSKPSTAERTEISFTPSEHEEPALPAEYYGNAFAFPTAISSAGELSRRPLGHALELVMKAKADVTEEYMNSLADLMVIKGRPHFTVVRAFLVSDVTRAGFGEVDFGWGKAAYGGPAKGGVGAIPGVASFYIPFTNKKGETGIVVPFCLPAPAMERFVTELDKIFVQTGVDPICKGSTHSFLLSAAEACLCSRQG